MAFNNGFITNVILGPSAVPAASWCRREGWVIDPPIRRDAWDALRLPDFLDQSQTNGKVTICHINLIIYIYVYIYMNIYYIYIKTLYIYINIVVHKIYINLSLF